MFSFIRQSPWFAGAVSLSAILVVYSTACTGGTETDNPVINFQSSGCKSEAAAFALTPSDVTGTTAALGRNYQDYDGFHCYAWELDEQNGALRVDLLNMNGGCQVNWSGDAERRADGGIDLQISNASCLTAVCGWCLYDFSFELSNIDGSVPLPLALIEDDCESREVFSELVIPLDAEPSGIRCRPAFPHALGEGLGAACNGELHMPCGEPICQSSGGGCSGDLICSEIEAGDSRCMPTCTQDTDCGLDVLICAEGTCTLEAPL